MKLKGIDVSFWKDEPDWSKAKSIDFVIMGVTQRYGIDPSFKHNYDGCKKAGFKLGAYKYSYALTPEESRNEATEIIDILDGRSLDLPIFLDLEWDPQKFIDGSLFRKIITEFESVVVQAGYRFGIYCNKFWFENYIPEDFQQKYDFWIASIPSIDDGIPHENLKPNYEDVSIVGWQYSWAGHVEGIDNVEFDMDEFYIDFEEEPVKETTNITASKVIRRAKAWIGCNGYTGTNHQIIDLYNNHKPLAQGYKVSYSDSWCDVFVSAVFIKLKATDLIGGTECGVERHVQLFKSAGIWISDASITPLKGDIIVYDWNKDAFADHIGIVTKVKDDGTIVTIEGNCDNAVKYSYVKVGDSCIRGFARPRYKKSNLDLAELNKSTHEIAEEVIAGKWGNGKERKQRLTEAGYDYDAVQAEVNRVLSE